MHYSKPQVGWDLLAAFSVMAGRVSAMMVRDARSPAPVTCLNRTAICCKGCPGAHPRPIRKPSATAIRVYSIRGAAATGVGR
jgi:hypothetical protein